MALSHRVYFIFSRPKGENTKNFIGTATIHQADGNSYVTLDIQSFTEYLDRLIVDGATHVNLILQNGVSDRDVIQDLLSRAIYNYGKNGLEYFWSKEPLNPHTIETETP